jgi:NAD(P)-dependent dehydrogenase (short-subunit alcohol dehydrogenase family)
VGALSAAARPRVALVTGASAGLGRATALELARRGVHVLAVSRTLRSGAALAADLERVGRGAGVLLAADLGQLAQVRALAEAVRTQAPRLDLLVLNAGVLCARRTLTPDGHEATLAVNHLAHYLLARLLHERLVAAAEPATPARVLVVSSSAHASGHLDWTDPTLARGYSAMSAYARSKLANLLFVQAAARRFDPAQVTVNALHPGGLRTGLARQLAWPLRLLMRLAFASPRRAAADLAWLATEPTLASVSGAYFVGRRKASPAPAACDEDAARAAWEVSARLVGLPS